jgi:hypothetical protein
MPEAAVVERPADELGDVAVGEVRQKKSSSACMAKLDRLTWASCDWFQIEDYRFGVRSTSGAFGEWVRYALGNFLADGPENPDADPLYALIVEDGASPSGRAAATKLHIFYYGTIDLVRTLDVRAVARSFLGEIESLTFPSRDDAVYLEASVIRGSGKAVLIPSLMVPSVSAIGRRMRRSFDVELPGQLSVALDPGTGHLIPSGRSLDIPDDALEALDRYVPVGSEPEPRAIIEDELRIDRVLTRGGTTKGLVPMPRGPVLFDLARAIRNLPRVGGRGVATIGRVLAEADVFEARWFRSAELVDVLEAALNGGRYVPDRTEATPSER